MRGRAGVLGMGMGGEAGSCCFLCGRTGSGFLEVVELFPSGCDYYSDTCHVNDTDDSSTRGFAHVRVAQRLGRGARRFLRIVAMSSSVKPTYFRRYCSTPPYFSSMSDKKASMISFLHTRWVTPCMFHTQKGTVAP